MRRRNLSVAFVATVALTGIFHTAFARAATPDALAPIGTSPCPDVRPGASVQMSGGLGGTLNFLFRGSDGHRYVGTAGHLVADEETLVWRRHGPTATIDDGTIIGRAVFASNFNGEARDFALIKLNRGVKSDPALCHWGGPTGINDDLSDEPTVLRLYGKGTGIGDVVPARTMVAATLSNEMIVGATGVVMFGDSGSPVISEDGRAVGIQFAVGLFPGANLTAGETDGFSPGNVGVYRLGPQLKLAEQALGMEFELLSAPLKGS